MTSSAVMPWCGESHGPPRSRQVMVFMILASFRCVGPSLSCPRVARVSLSGLRPNTDYFHGRQHVWVGDQLDLAHQACFDMEHEGHLDHPGVEPRCTKLIIDRERCRPPDAVEESSHGR